ncbi:type 3 dihydrofolate reductase [Aliidiomarina quisquiliarum]|uniref:type 3 dihydrofolate reductase n=1 Tax=Aliidiomarina quisquiliarum TaxID=2938947 RepID=UPI00208F5DF8|nr:type 3 dihydrofolate reductase [Aliidiomarina quisquiliarum]MCO4321526.1 type 3 dihydrofolate reductase [Aliidiomarina quisquiliarum]
MQHISLVAAMANNRVIGKNGQMPWHLPSELQYFKEITMGKPIVMGRTTFESIGRPLPGRQNIVISRQPHLLPATVDAVKSPAEALALVAQAAEVMVIGGGQIYDCFIPHATRMYLTHIDMAVEGDTYFPIWDDKQWLRKKLRQVPGVNAEQPAYTSYVYEKLR